MFALRASWLSAKCDVITPYMESKYPNMDSNNNVTKQKARTKGKNTFCIEDVQYRCIMGMRARYFAIEYIAR